MKLLSSHDQDTANERQNASGYQCVVTLNLHGFKSNWLALSGVLQESIASNCCRTTGVSFSEISGTDRHTGVDSQALGVNSVCSTIGEGLLGLAPAGSWSCPSANISISGLNAHGVFGIDSLNLGPTKRHGFGGVNDGQPLVKEDYLWSAVCQVGQECKSSGDKGQLYTSSNRTCVPRTDVHSENKKIESANCNQAGFSPKNRRVALASHVAIVSQKVDN